MTTDFYPGCKGGLEPRPSPLDPRDLQTQHMRNTCHDTH
jgi:hypothetical protein